MIKIRLQRAGKKNSPFYKIVCSNKSVKTGGKSLDTIGFYFPKNKSKNIDKEKLNKWLKVGAKTSKAFDAISKL